MKTHGRTLSFCLTLVTLAVPAGAAFAQEAAAPPAAVDTARSHGASSAGAGLGVGAAAFISGMAGPQVVYDFGIFHLEGLFGFDHRDAGPNATNTSFDFGASGWYHLHAGDRSDFSIGGGIGFIHSKTTNQNSNDATVFEPGVLVRAFVTDNVAVHGRLGLDFVFGDNTNSPNGSLGGSSPHTSLAGQITSGFGFTYYFR